MHTGIITYHNRYNFGAVLQAYALSSMLKEIGHDVQMIDYRQERKNTDGGLNSKLKSLKMKFGVLYNASSCKRQKHKFELFTREYLPLSPQVYRCKKSIMDHPPIFDAYITGSDQVWNTDLCGNDIGVYLLEFVPEGKKKISFAASFGKKYIDQHYLDTFSSHLRTFTNISIREEESIEIVKKISGMESEALFDPVFLLSSDKWQKIGSDYKSEKPYILLYTLRRDPLLLEAAKKIAKKTDCDIVHIPLYSWNTFKLSGVKRVIRDAGPIDFISILRGARFVCTNSFHGTSFSIIFKKPFLCTLKKPIHVRIENLLRKIDLADHGVSSIEEADKLINKDLAWDINKTGKLICKQKTKAEDFLRNALSENGVKGSEPA